MKQIDKTIIYILLVILVVATYLDLRIPLEQIFKLF